jgi:hypothetical protein
MGLFSPSPNLVKVIPSKHHGFAQLSDWRLLVLRHGPSARLQGVAIVAGYEPPVQRSDYGRRDPRSTSADAILVFAGPRLAQETSLELVSPAYPTVTGHVPGNALYSSAHARNQMQTPWTGDCIPRITAYCHRACEHSSH